jgi:hypothetical protein
MTPDDKNVMPTSSEDLDEVLAPATPGAEGLPLSDEAEEPSDG